MKNYKTIICVTAAVCLLGTAAFCGFRIYHHYAQVDEQTEAFEELAEMVEQTPAEETVPDDTPVSEGEDVLAKYQELYLQNEEDFNSYVGKCKELALYDTGVTAEYGDRLITLSTCEYSAQNGRLVVVAKKVG